MHFPKITTSRLFFAACTVVLLLINCSDYNPFANPSNIRAHATFSFPEYDTLNIFETESLEVVVSVGEKVDSVRIVAPMNRFWSDTTLLPPFHTKTFKLRISLFDTGAGEISLYTFRGDPKPVEKEYRYYAVWNLRQNTIVGSYEDTLGLSTKPVADKDVRYNWDFGDGLMVSSLRSDTSVVLQEQSSSSRGRLYVSELHGTHQSPAYYFDLNIQDDHPPLIELLHDGYKRSNDTIVTGDTIFPLKVKITDGASGSIVSAFVDGERFDAVNGSEYVKRVAITADNSPKKITVTAFDRKYHESKYSFQLVYDPKVRRKNTTALSIYIPSTDSTVTGSRQYCITGGLEDYRYDTLFLKCTAPEADTQLVVPLRGATEWQLIIPLKNGKNTVKVRAQNRNGDSLAQAYCTLVYDKELIDTAAPVIWQVRMDSLPIEPGGRYITTRSTIGIEVTAFDEGSRIDSLYIDKVLAFSSDTASASSYSYTWGKTVQGLKHEIRELDIRAVDEEGNDTTYKTFVAKNQKPYLLSDEWNLPGLLFVDSTYIDRLEPLDNDLDKVTIEKRRGPESFTIDSEGNIRWVPSKDDVGKDSIIIVLYDTYERSRYVFEYEVEDLSQKAPKVRIQTTEADFPDFITAGTESLLVTLSVVDSTGKPPFSFTANPFKENRHVDIIDDSIISWKPVIGDTGNVCLRVIATDGYGESDSSIFCFGIVPPNRPCSLSARYTGQLDSSDRWDLTEAGPAETLIVKIHDEDLNHDPREEEFTVLVKKNGVVNQVSADSNGIVTLPISPMSMNVGLDTMSIEVTDIAGHTGTLKYVLNYGVKPGTPYGYSPTDTFFTDSTIDLTWSCNDPDGDTLGYDIYLGLQGEMKRVAKNIKQTRYKASVHTTGTLYWSVVATDGKNRTDGPIERFFHENPNPVKIITKAEELFTTVSPSENLWSHTIQLENGIPPYILSGEIDGANTQPVFSGTSVTWNPTPQDSGLKRVTLIITDGYSNKDTLNTLVYVLGNSPGTDSVDFVVDGFDMEDTISLDGIEYEKADFTIRDANFQYLGDYDIFITKGEITVIKEAKNGKTFTLWFYKDPQVPELFGYEDVYITIEDSNGYRLGKHIVVDYGL